MAERKPLDSLNQTEFEGEQRCADGDSLMSRCKESMQKALRSLRRFFSYRAMCCRIAHARNAVDSIVDKINDWVAQTTSSPKIFFKASLPEQQSLQGDAPLKIPQVVVKANLERHRGDGLRRFKRGLRRHEEAGDLDDVDSQEQDLQALRASVHHTFFDTPRDDEERLDEAIRRIKAIDSQNGTTPANPEVAEILRGLGTPYDALSQAIQAVCALQTKELEQQRKPRTFSISRGDELS